jgi:hypothetical protein
MVPALYHAQAGRPSWACMFAGRARGGFHRARERERILARAVLALAKARRLRSGFCSASARHVGRAVERDAPLPDDQGAVSPSEPEQDARPPERTDAEQELAQRLRVHVERLAGLIGERHLRRRSALEAAAAVIEREFAALGDAVERQTYDAGGGEVANLIVERRGVQQPGDIVILGAHYDTVEGTPGADDNASAVAVLIEVARLLRNHLAQRTLRFVAFACEEPPHFYTQTMGSDVYARRCRERGEKLVGALCLEMVGYYSTEPDSQQLPSEVPRILRPAFPHRGDFLASVGNFRSWRLAWAFRRGFKRAVRFPLYSIVLPEAVHSIRLSDNSSFWDYGYPALMLTDTSFLRNPHYHRPTDTPETLDYVRMARAAVGVAGGVAQLAKAALTSPCR